jgi:hypothetical protein
MGTDQKHQDTQDDGGSQKKKIPILAPAGASKQARHVIAKNFLDMK